MLNISLFLDIASMLIFSFFLVQIERAKGRAVTLMESILRLSNIDLIFTYTVKGKTGSSPRATSFVQNDIITPAFDDAVVCLILY